MLPVAALVALALAGCTMVAPGTINPGEVVEGTSEANTIDAGAVRDELGEFPPYEDPTPATAAAYNTRFLDQQWTAVVINHPDAVRPEVATPAPADDAVEPQRRCLQAIEGADEAAAVAGYTCFALHPTVPYGVLSRAQARYVYDYWIDFVLPCYADNGFAHVSDPPDGDDFADAWPFVSWRPNPLLEGQAPTDPEHQRIESLCPSDVEWLR